MSKKPEKNDKSEKNEKKDVPAPEAEAASEETPAANKLPMQNLLTLTNIGKVAPRPVVTEMETSYLDYAMSVIVARALPDARDGLKPVHRRILFSMSELGLRSSAKFRKCALVVGDVLGKYHPHGDSAVYEALVRMAQDFSMRYPIVHGQGNFGSIDGDGAAAMRYTEAKMAKIADELLQDIEKETVDFMSNYDATRKEPTVLPAKIPNLLLNGTVGIAVGMATNIPPHNLTEIVDATEHLLDHPQSTVEDLLEFVQGPDFPTGGIVYNKEAIKQAYLTGRGSVIVRAKAEIEETKEGRYHIRISEIPYQVNKSSMIEKMAGLVQDKIIEGISDIRDESDRTGIRLIIELKKDSYPQKVLNQLFKHTDLQTSFGYNMIALADGLQPRLLNLQEILQIFIDHRRVVVRKRVTFDRDRAKERAHILEGLSIALNDIDKVIATIKKSETKEIAKENLVKKFKLSEIQADAILQMRLQTLAGLERKKIEDELAEKKKFIAECEAILKDPKKIDKILKSDMEDVKNAYGDTRRTTIVKHDVGEFSAKDTIPNAPMIVTLTETGYVKRLSPMQFRAQQRGGKGVKGMTTKDDDEILSLLHVMNHDDLLFFTNTGRVFKLPAYELPQGSRVAKGQAIVNLLQLQPEERITAILRAQAEGKKFLFLATREGTVKRTELAEFDNIRRSGLIAQKVPAGDELRWVVETDGKNEIILLTQKGKAIRFKEDDVRPMGRAAAGVRGIKLSAGDRLVEASAIIDPKKSKLLVVMENGLGKMTPVEQYRFQGRSGTGVKAAQLTAKTGDIVGGCILEEGADGDLLCLSKQGQAIRMQLSDIPSLGRATQGVIVMRLNAKDKVATMSVVMHDKEAEEAVLEAAEEQRVEEVEAIEKEERRVKRAAKTAQK
ncbi:MAG: DNA gyrase subunit A [Candidatus Peribacteraceae bacterium]|nr:DNA gyrase subunit A [Candidatus Peribacteraceae bacterium]MDD5074856.1 DNA gyrase subunit A [Candidatus Peribacteraceae bacterium]